MPVPQALQSFIVDLFLTVMYEEDIGDEKKLIEKALRKVGERGIPGLRSALEEVGSGRVTIADVDEVVQMWASNFGLDVKLETRQFFKRVLQELNKTQ